MIDKDKVKETIKNNLIYLNYENGKNTPELLIMLAIARLYDVSVEDIAYRDMHI